MTSSIPSVMTREYLLGLKRAKDTKYRHDHVRSAVDFISQRVHSDAETGATQLRWTVFVKGIPTEHMNIKDGLSLPCVDDIITELRTVFPDSRIEFQKKELCIDWSHLPVVLAPEPRSVPREKVSPWCITPPVGGCGGATFDRYKLYVIDTSIKEE